MMAKIPNFLVAVSVLLHYWPTKVTGNNLIGENRQVFA